MLSIRRIIVCLDLSRLHVSADNSISPGLSPALANSAAMAGIQSIPIAVAGIVPSRSSPASKNAYFPDPPDPLMPPDTNCFRSIIESQTAAFGVTMSQYEEFTTEEWCRILASEKCHSDVILAFDLHQNPQAPSPPDEKTWQQALKDFGGILWLHHSSQSLQCPPIALANPITDVIAPITSDTTAMDIIFDAVHAAKSLQARLWIVPGKFRDAAPGESTPDTQTIYGHLAHCDYRTLPFGVRVTEPSNDLDDTLRRQLEECPVPMLLQQRNPADDSCVPAGTHPLFSSPQSSLLLLPAEGPSFRPQHD